MQSVLFEPPSKYLLLSLQEEPYREILNGTKKYEYRTHFPKESTTAFVYVSQKVKAVKAIIEFDCPVLGSAEEISRLSDQIKPGSYDSLMRYLKGGTGYAIPVKKITEFEPISLEELRKRFSGFTVPQSYYFLETKEELLQFFLERAKG